MESKRPIEHLTWMEQAQLEAEIQEVCSMCILERAVGNKAIKEARKNKRMAITCTATDSEYCHDTRARLTSLYNKLPGETGKNTVEKLRLVREEIIQRETENTQ